jgi:TRAP-type mannitol/chloroaromatic compound transport system permease large subunit
MLARGYSPAFSTGVIAAGGTLKSLIPPSLVMIIYCVVAKTFILDMFVAAIVPALMTIAFNLIAIAVAVRYRPQVAPDCDAARRTISDPSARGIRRHLQRHFHSQRSSVSGGHSGAVIRAGAATDKLEHAA